MHYIPVGLSLRRPRRGYFLHQNLCTRIDAKIMNPPQRVIAFFDGQNIRYRSREAFPGASDDYNPHKLADLIAARQGWQLVETRYYSGIPDHTIDPHRAKISRRRLRRIAFGGCVLITRTFRYNADGTGREKGIDIRIALDLLRLGLQRQMDVALIFSQDQDFAEVADEIRAMNIRHGHFVRMASAFPSDPAYTNRRGIDRTDWHPFTRQDWDSCLYPHHPK